ncbi:hypothetical protein HPB50_003592 [Hyalomma asiaticum]|uniref:Uncharacterized protein n=1 Tax=Hyalomma asiaticum TaxID=266040 RepID=A0ACB7SRC1_HYAAI|nr:hypothetical protein HPB50_003592 [Hyalomma asiaticum]
MLIRAQILHRLGIRNPPANGSLSAPLNNSTLRLVEEIVRSPPPSVQDITTARTIYSERIQSFYPSSMGESLKHIPTKLRPATLEEWLADSSPDLMKALLGHLTLLGLSEG